MNASNVGAEASIPCRLCAAEATYLFARTHVDGDAVRYYRCVSCKSLETETPYWLDQVYRVARNPGEELPDLDTGAVERTTYCRTAVYFLCTIGSAIPAGGKVIDWGGGPGLLARMLRDAGIDAYSEDKYIPNHFSAGFGYASGTHYSLATSFEVFEHFASPSQEIEAIFSMRPVHVLISTEMYRSQGPEWPYLGPPKSQHIFFYAHEALQMIGAKHGYGVTLLPRGMVLFSRVPIAALRMALIRSLLASRYVAEIAFALSRKQSLVGHDAAVLRERLGSGLWLASKDSALPSAEETLHEPGRGGGRD